MALVLQAVQNIADQAPVAWLSAVDVALVLKCAREAPDSAVRNAALALLEVLAKKLPDSTLQHVLEVSPSDEHIPHCIAKSSYEHAVECCCLFCRGVLLHALQHLCTE